MGSVGRFTPITDVFGTWHFARFMKMKFFIFTIILLITNCKDKSSIAIKSNTETNKEIPQLVFDEKTNNIITAEIVPLLIGGRIITEDGKPLKNTIDEINNIYSLYLIIDPLDHERRSSLENLELLQNLKDITIRGKNLDKVDFSPISSLLNLEKLEIIGDITRLPDMTHLKRLRKIEIKYDIPDNFRDFILPKLESFNGISAPNLKEINVKAGSGNIDSLAPLNNLLELESLNIVCYSDRVLKIADMTNLPSLKSFTFIGGKLDMSGIEHLSSLEILVIYDCDPINLEGIGKLNKLEHLMVNLVSDKPSIEFLKNITSIISLDIFGYYRENNNNNYRNDVILQVLDASPIATIKTIKYLLFENIIIKNISNLDVLDEISGGIRLRESKLYDEKETSKHGFNYGIRH